MRIRCITVLCLATVAVSGCVTTEPLQMQTCVDGAAPVGVSTKSFSAAPRKAQRYSDEKYGADCFVCAQVFDRPHEYMLHITSPFDDLLINTSAAITVRKADGVITERGIWHSCHARIRKTTELVPGKSLERTRGS
jgi:hypothetical protein